MFHYSFTNDLRIKTLDTSLKKASICFINNTIPSSSENKSLNNNIKTLGFYFNLTKNSNCAKVASTGDVRTVVINFIKKFQFPNLHSKSNFNDCCNDNIMLAPMRTIVKLLYTMDLLYDDNISYLTREEIKNFIFYNEEVAKKKNFDMFKLISDIIEHRKNGNYPKYINLNSADHKWNQEDRQMREMLNVFNWSGFIINNNEKYIINHHDLSNNNKADIFDIINYNQFWDGNSIDSYRQYMDLEQDIFDSYITKRIGKGDIMNIMNVKNFKINNLPSIFHSEFSKRYIPSLLAKPFVILTGNSGTGKTRIAKKFAEYLEESIGNNEKNWLLVPVGADWTDNTKILGYFNPLANEGKGEYVKSNILKFIENANKPENKDIPFFLILDEMNLSHVERYFSDFLSHMETPDIPFELDGYDKKINYPKNLFITGTVNIDETTYMFSPKVLDRANVIEFKPKIKDVMNLFKDSNEEISSSIIANNGTSQAFLKLSKEIFSSNNFIDDTHFSFSQNDDNQQFSKNIDFVYDIFSEIYKIIEKNNFEFAFRTVKEIRQYILASSKISAEDEVNLNEIIDEQLLQKILPKIHGNEKEIGQLLEELIKLCEKYDLKLSEGKIKQMKGKLANVQYASFI